VPIGSRSRPRACARASTFPHARAEIALWSTLSTFATGRYAAWFTGRRLLLCSPPMPRPPAPPLVPIAVAATLFFGGAAPARAAPTGDDTTSTARYVLRAELGPEIDTNAHRTEQVKAAGVPNAAPVVSPLARAVLSGSLQDIVADGQQVAVSATVAGKVFEKEAARGEDVAIAETSALWRAALGQSAALSASGTYYEAFQRPVMDPDYVSERRDFRSLTGTLRLSRAIADHVELGGGGGYRLFSYKADRSYDFQSPSAHLDVRWAREADDGAADWEATARASYERRAFAGKALLGVVTGCPMSQACVFTTSPDGRVDHLFTAAADVARTGAVLVGGGYAAHLNRSTSFGETVTRHFLTARFAAELPLGFAVAARVEVLLARYADAIVVAQSDVAGRAFITYDDENRSSARVDLSRNLTERLQLIARYTFYTNELAATAVTYRRQTALLSLAFTLEK
jgi:hypothetical protein